MYPDRTATLARRLMVSLLAWCLGAWAMPVLAATPVPLQAAMARVLGEEALAGAVWAIVPAQGDILVDAVGVRDLRNNTPLRADDRVHIGSVTKTLLAAGVLRLASQGRLDLDAPVSALLPDVGFDNPWAAHDPVTVRHLLDHTAGLDDLRLWQFFSTSAQADTPLAAAFAGEVMPLRVRSRPGTRFSYSNTGYTLLGRVIESVAGTRYEQYLDAHLLHPLGMHESTFAFVSQQGPNADPRLAMGHFEDGTAHAAVPIYLRPAGQFTTTAADMARFARFLMGDGRVDGRDFIDPRLLRAMGRPLGTEAARAGLEVGYALGLSTRDRHGATGRCHGGNIVGYRAMLCLFPEQQRAFFVSVNTDSETADYARLDALLVDALKLPAAALPARVVNAWADAAAWEGFYIPAPNRFATFAWLDTVFGAVRLRHEAGVWRFDPLQSAPVTLTPVGGQRFMAPDRTMASHALLRSDEGARVITTGMQSYQRIAAWKLYGLWASLLAGVLGLGYVAAVGLVRLLRGRLRASQALFVPFLSVLALALPLPLFLRQSFLQLGDLTLASGLLAAVTAALPLAMLLGLARSSSRPDRASRLDAGALLAVLQCVAVLAAWRLMPVRLWV